MSAAASQGGAPSLVDLLLAEQRTLRAVDEFADWHAKPHRPGARFETLIPSRAPEAGQQLAFVVDLDACTGCKACVTACHSLNGLEPGETWRRVGEIEAPRSTRASGPTRQTVTSACHHCESPACLAGCPVQAYEKDAVTGIVFHLDDQCIGCRYCQLMCPYDVPQYSERLGIVRKCDMCQGRLAAGEAPACVQGCPNGAISIEIVDLAERSPRGEAAAPDAGAMLLPMAAGGMASSAFTTPSTRYRTRREPALAMRGVEDREPLPAPAHTPLVLMLVLTQGAVGTVALDLVLSLLAPAGHALEPRLPALVAATLMTSVGLAASVLHLGRPQWAFRAFLGLRTSWMSREIVVLGAFAGALVVALATSAIGLWGAGLVSAERSAAIAGLAPFARLAAVASGLAGLYCSARIYAVTKRPLWRLDRTLRRFAATALTVGSATLIVASWVESTLATADPTRTARGFGPLVALPLLMLVAVATKLVLERGRLVHGEIGDDELGDGELGADEVALERTRRLLAGPLERTSQWRWMLGIVFGLGTPAAALAVASTGGAEPAVGLVLFLGLIGCVVGEALERHLFFRGEAMRGMPR